MQTHKSLNHELQSLTSLSSFVLVYEEVAATRMQKIRVAVLKARQFLEGLAMIFAEVKLTYIKQSGAIEAKSKLNKNGRTVAVFLSANSGLYGDIVERTFQSYAKYLADTKADAVVVGKLGLRMLQEQHPEILYNYFDLSDDAVDLESLRLIMRYLLQFERIVVFYGKFNSLLTQSPSLASISGDSLPEVNLTAKPQNLYLFEPDLSQVLEVFESEILSSIFEQTMHESLLAKFASRLQHLDRSLDNIQKRLQRANFEVKQLKHKNDNRKQLSRISGIGLWQTG